MKASARAVLTANGSVEIASATADIGPGTYTMMTQLAAEMLGVPLENVTAKLGDSALPDAPVEGGSFTASSVGCRHSRRLPGGAEGASRAGAKDSGIAARRRQARRCRVRRRQDPAQGRRSAGRSRSPTRCAPARPTGLKKKPAPSRRWTAEYAHFAHSAVFAEVKVDEQLGVIRVTRVVSAVAAGRILNPKTRGQPDSRRRGRGHRHGAARGDGDRPPFRTIHDP